MDRSFMACLLLCVWYVLFRGVQLRVAASLRCSMRSFDEWAPYPSKCCHAAAHFALLCFVLRSIYFLSTMTGGIVLRQSPLQCVEFAVALRVQVRCALHRPGCRFFVQYIGVVCARRELRGFIFSLFRGARSARTLQVLIFCLALFCIAVCTYAPLYILTASMVLFSQRKRGFGRYCGSVGVPDWMVVS